MPLNGSGVASPPGANYPAVANTLITAANRNGVDADIYTILSTALYKDGQQTVTANIPFGGYRITGVGDASASADAANVKVIQNQVGVWCGTAGGTANALTLTPSPAITAYATGQSFVFKAGASNNSAATTIAISGLTTIALQFNGADCTGGELKANKWYRITLDSASTCQGEGIAGVTPAASTDGFGVVELLHIDHDTGHRDMIADGWMPAFFNQQWGGAPHYFEMVDGATGVPYKFEAATGHIDQNQPAFNVADATARTWSFQGFKVSSTQSITALWVKIGKLGNPTNNLEMRILPDDGSGTKPTGSTAITNGTATAQSGKLHSSDTIGQWVRFVFPTPCALTADTFYHITLKSSGAVDGSNYWLWARSLSAKYPHGNSGPGDGTPTWSAETTNDFIFLIEAPATTASLQTGGIFSDGKLQFFEGSPLNQSNGRVKNLRDFRGWDLTDFTLYTAGTAWTKDKTIVDIGYGLDHDRIVLRSAVTTGYATLTVYESDGTVHTVTGTTDISTGDHQVSFRVRAKNDGSDAVQLLVDGVSEGTPVASASIAFDTLFANAQIGTMWIGGGFALAPTFSGSSIGINGFSGLPSTLGWTYGGAATEANAFSVSGGKLYKNYGGYASTDTGYYRKTTAGMNNAVGTSLLVKSRVARSPNTKSSSAEDYILYDGTKSWQCIVNEYYVEPFNAASIAVPQIDNKSADSVHHMLSKGSDGYWFHNHRLLVDGTEQNTGATATNEVSIGDFANGAGENADSVHSYWKYYTTAWLPPQFTSGSLSEFAIWNGDKTSILPALYNSGTMISVKQYCGVEKNYVGDGVVQTYFQKGITSAPSTAGSFALVPELEAFVVGSEIRFDSVMDFSNTNSTNSNFGPFVDGDTKVLAGANSFNIGIAAGTSDVSAQTVAAKAKVPFGLHKVEQRWNASGGTMTSNSTRRQVNVEARA